MKFLLKFGFSKDDIEKLKMSCIPNLLMLLEREQKTVSKNIKYLLNLGVINIREIFLNYYDMFLMDNSNFVKMFNIYDQKDLVVKLAKNVRIMEYL